MSTSEATSFPSETPKSGRLVWFVAAGSFLIQLWMMGFFSFGGLIPSTSDINPGNYRETRFVWPPQGYFSTDYYLGFPNFSPNFDPATLLAHLPPGLYFTVFFPLFSTLALLSAYFLLRELGFSCAISCCCATILAWHGDLVSSILPGHFPAPIMWAVFPLALALALRCARTPDWFLAALTGAFTGFLVSLLPDRGALCSLLIGSAFLWEIGRKNFSEQWPTALRLLAIIITFAGLIAWPTLYGTFHALVFGIEKRPISASEGQVDQYSWATQWSFAPEDFLTYPAPGFLGWFNGNPEGTYWGRVGQSADWPLHHQGMRNFFLGTFTIGTVATLLAILGIIALLKNDFRKVFLPGQIALGSFFIFVAAMGIILALGKFTPIYSVIFKLPGMSTWRNPLKFLMPVNLILIILSAYGLHFLIQTLPQPKGRENSFIERFWLLSSGAFGVLWLLSYLFFIALTVRLVQLEYNEYEINGILTTLHHSLLVALVSSLILYFVWRVFRQSEKFQKYEWTNPLVQKSWRWLLQHPTRSWIGLCGLVAVAQLFWVQSHFILLFDYHTIYASNPVIDQLKARTDNMPVRVKIAQDDMLLHQWLSTTFPYYDIPSLDVPAMSRMPSDYAKFFATLSTNPERLYALSGVRYLAVPVAQLEQLQSQTNLQSNITNLTYYALQAGPQDNNNTPPPPSHAVVHLRDYLPKAILIPQLEKITNDDDLLKRLASVEWNPRQSILVNPADKIREWGSNTPLSAAAHVVMKEYSPRRIVLQTDTPVPCYLLLNDRFDEGWRVRLNGAVSRIFRADFIMRGMEIPAGHSEIVMDFCPTIVPTYVALVTWALLLVVTPFWLKRRS